MSGTFTRSAVVLALAASVGGCTSAPSASTPGRQVTATVSDNGHTLHLAVGDRLTVVLSSTYWSVPASNSDRVLRPDSHHYSVAPLTGSSSTIDQTCVVGEGCGSVTATFTATSAGGEVVTASRTSCGEAMRCVGSAGTYRLTVLVGSGR